MKSSNSSDKTCRFSSDYKKLRIGSPMEFDIECGDLPNATLFANSVYNFVGSNGQQFSHSVDPTSVTSRQTKIDTKESTEFPNRSSERRAEVKNRSSKIDRRATRAQPQSYCLVRAVGKLQPIAGGTA